MSFLVSLLTILTIFILVTILDYLEKKYIYNENNHNILIEIIDILIIILSISLLPQ